MIMILFEIDIFEGFCLFLIKAIRFDSHLHNGDSCEIPDTF